MAATLRELRPVHVVGVGLHPYQRPGDTPYTALGVKAVGDALADAGIEWRDVETAYTGTATTAMGLSRLMYRHFGSTGIPMAQVENASASGSTAFRQACIDVAAGLADVAIAVGRRQAAQVRHAAARRGLARPRRRSRRAVHALRAPREPLHPRARRDRGAVRARRGEEQRERRAQPERAASEGAVARGGARPAAHQRSAHATAVLSRRRRRRRGDRRLRRGDRTPRSRSGPRGPRPVVGLPIRDRVPRRELRRRARRARRSASPSTTPASRRTTSTSSSCTTRSRSRSCCTSKRSGWLPSGRPRHSSRRVSSTSAGESR